MAKQRTQPYLLSGRIADQKEQPIQGLIVFAYDQDPKTPDNPLGQPAVTNAKGEYRIAYADEDFRIAGRESGGADIIVRVYSADTLVAESKPLRNAPTKAEINVKVDKVPEQETRQLKGAVRSEDGKAAAHVTVQVWRRDLFGVEFLGNTTTDDKGLYALPYKVNTADNPSGNLDLTVKVYQNNGVLLHESPTAYNVPKDFVLQVKLPEAPEQAPEYARLLSDLKPFLGKRSIGELREGDGQNQISLLAGKTGWDARAIAMAAAAEKASAETDIPAGHWYAAYRNGVPNDTSSVYAVSPAAFGEVVKKAVENKLISGVTEAEISNTVSAHQRNATAFALNRKAATGMSTLGSMLDLRLDSNQKSVFAEVFQAHQGTSAAFWTTLEERGIPKASIDQLQIDGKLAYLTLQNQPVVSRLIERQINQPVEMVRQGLYEPEAWKPLIGSDAPEGLSVEDYAGHMAALVKRSYPTEVLGAMLRREELNLSDNADTVEETAAFFENNSDGFQIGVKPVKQTAAFQQLSTEAQALTMRAERLYQMSPGDDALKALAATGLNSAYDIVQYTREEFQSRYSPQLGSGIANAVYTKAHEVHSAVMNVATAYLTQRASPNVYVLSGASPADEAIRRGPVLHAYPTLENVFGELDYCACDHCRSVLSPAAYLVDLLRFITLEPEAIRSGSNPIDVLLARRPDIEHVRLNCENTNTVLPYIDLVNEILEHYVLLADNGNLTDWKNYEGYNIEPGAKTEDLLADPAFVDDRAYDLTANAIFPLGLPFDRPLDTMRLLFQLWDVRYDEALAAFDKTADAQREVLGLSPKEWQLFTQNAAHPLPEYFGENPVLDLAGLNANIANAVVFSRRMGVSYEHLASILKTRFVNPFAATDDLAKLDALDISLANIKLYCDGGMTDATFDALVPASIDSTDYDGDVKLWLKTHCDAIMSMMVLTETSANPSPCSFDTVELRRALPDPANNLLTALDFHKLHRFIRLWKKTGWSIETTDLALAVLSDTASKDIGNEASLDAAFTQVLSRLSYVVQLQHILKLNDKKIPDLLGLWDKEVEPSVRLAQWSRLLRLRTEDFDILSSLSSFDPTAALETSDPAAIRFVKSTILLKSVGLKASDLNFLLRHTDPGGKLSLSPAALLQSVQSVRTALTTVESELGTPPPEADLTYARNQVGRVFEREATEAFFSLLEKTTTFEANLTWPTETLPATLNLPEFIIYDHFQKTLSSKQVLSQPDLLTLQARVNALNHPNDFPAGTTSTEAATLQTQINTALQTIHAEGQSAFDTIFTQYPVLQTAYTAYDGAVEANKISALLDALLPELRTHLRRQAIVQSLASILKTDVQSIALMVGDPAVLHAPSDTTRVVATVFEALDQGIESVASTDGILSFFVEAPRSTDYNFYVNAPQGTQVKLEVENRSVIDTTIDASGETGSTSRISLKTGQLYQISWQITALPVGQRAVLRWQTPGAGKTAIPASRIVSTLSTEEALTALVRLHKAAQWQRLLKLTAVELAHLGHVLQIDAQGWLNALPTTGGAAPATLALLWRAAHSLANFALMKKMYVGTEDAWAQVLQNPEAQTQAGQNLLESLTGWTTPDLTVLLTHFGWTRSDLSDLEKLLKIKTAFELINRTGFSAQHVLDWTGAPDGNLVRSAKATIRAQMGERAWLEAAPAMTDPLRNRQRDALVQWILHGHRPSLEVDTPDKLYEFFLIDVEMDACMKTSRIKQAISTVQLFIHRCLLNLEPDVSPTSIRRKQWEWMNRYRVWEANRKIFLYPENWLEPEFRDNKSFLFRELEGELLKADITEELAEAAYLNYLKKLDDIARLDVCGMYLEENEKGNPNDDILHVFARSIGEDRRYYYRRYEYGYWTPWEKVDAPIKGDHILPIIWKGRLFVFWLTIFQKGAEPDRNKSPQTMGGNYWGQDAKVDVDITFCWAEYSKGKWVSPKSGDLKNPVRMTGLSSFNSKDILVYAQKIPKSDTPKASEKIAFHLIHPTTFATFTILFTSKNAPPVIESGWNYENIWESIAAFNAVLFRAAYDNNYDNTKLDSVYIQVPGKRDFRVGISQPKDADEQVRNATLLTMHNVLPAEFRVLPLRHALENQWEAPLFFLDSQRVFSAQPEEEVFPAIWEWQGYFDWDYDRYRWRPEFEISVLDEVLRIKIPGVRDPLVNPVVDPIPNELTVNSKVLTTLGNFKYGGTIIGQFGESTTKETLEINNFNVNPNTFNINR